MPTALITGAGGFCARHLARRLRQGGSIRIVGVSRRKEPPADISLDEYIQLDVSDQDQVACCVRWLKPDFVFHLAGLADGAPEEAYRINTLGTVYLLESLRLYAPQARVLLVGSAAEYGKVEASRLPVTEEHPCQPVGAYGVSKHAMTLAGLDYAQMYGMKVVVARPFNIIGAGIPPSLVVGAVLNRAKVVVQAGEDLVVRVGNLHTERDFIVVEDAVDAYLRMVQGEYWGEVFNICSGRPYSIRSIVTLLLSFSPRLIRFEVDPSLVRTVETTIIYGSCEKAHKAFGFKPVKSLEATIRAAWQYEMEGVI